MKHVVVFAEHRQGKTRKVTFELASEARRLADALGGKAVGVALGPGAAALAKELEKYPLDLLYVNEDAAVDGFLLDPIVDYLEAAVREVGPSLVLIPNTLSGRDVAGRLMVRLDCGLVADVVEIRFENGAPVCVSPKLGGVLVTNCLLRPAEYGVVTVRPSAFAAQPGGAGAETVQLPAIEKPFRATIASDVEEGAGELALEEAPVVVAGGRGLGGPEPFDTMLKPLAKALGGADRKSVV